jgi:hypothetical protein
MTSTVIGPFISGDDGDAQLFAGGPSLAIKDVLLEQREYRFRGGVVAGRPNLARGSDHAGAMEAVELALSNAHGQRNLAG